MLPVGARARIVPVYIGQRFQAIAGSQFGGHERTISVMKIDRSSTGQWIILGRYHTLPTYNDEWISLSSSRLVKDDFDLSGASILYGDTVRQRCLTLKWLPVMHALTAGQTDHERYILCGHDYQSIIAAILDKDTATIICSFIGFTVSKTTDDADALA
jgi:hypothetical protein